MKDKDCPFCGAAVYEPPPGQCCLSKCRLCSIREMGHRVLGCKECDIWMSDKKWNKRIP